MNVEYATIHIKNSKEKDQARFTQQNLKKKQHKIYSIFVGFDSELK